MILDAIESSTLMGLTMAVDESGSWSWKGPSDVQGF